MSAPTVIGFLGTQLDGGTGNDRWHRWRPTVSLAQQPDLELGRLELLVPQVERARLVVDDVRRLSPGTEVVLHPFALRDPWDFEEVYGALFDFVRERRFAEGEEVWVHLTTGTHVAQICWFLLIESGFLPAKILQTSPPRRGGGAEWQLIDLDLAKYDRIAARHEGVRDASRHALKGGIETRDPAYNALVDRIEHVATASASPILLTGPTGAGKSQLARRIYELKRERRQLSGPLCEVNCATLRGDQVSSALFGHRKGAFTGATESRPGLLLTANGGLVFLDEIGELGLDEQAMLLRAVEDRRFLPVGADREVESDFQLVAGTNRDLRARVREGRFREDLLARIDLWSFRLPALRDRLADLEPNLDHELELASRRAGRRVTLNREARDRFLAFATGPEGVWAANFRDLGGAVTRMATLSPTGRIGVATVDEEIDRLRSQWGASAEPDAVTEVLGDRPIDRFDRVQLADVLAVCARSSSLSEAGRALFAVSRAERTSVNDADRLRKYLARFDLTFDLLRRR
ncbi:MAG: RNA repair transcriptional activator RtcR [Myxococcota bacterium]